MGPWFHSISNSSGLLFMESPSNLQSKHVEKEKEDEFQKLFKELTSTLPRGRNWGDFRDVYEYQGFWLHSAFLQGVVAAQQQFQAQPTDIFLCNLPKTGTTWLKSLTFSILTRTSFDESNTPLLSKLPHELVPFMELDHAKFSTQRHLGVPLMATHVPYPSLPRSIIDSGCKIVYICRNPKDLFVSSYHFGSAIEKSQNAQLPNLDEAFEKFCEGECIYGPYWDHVLGYWKASLDHPERVLFLKYEEMSDDVVFYVKKLAGFIGFPFSPKEQQEGVPEKIVKMCSFEKLSSLEVNQSEKCQRRLIQNWMYFRKGKVGDWQNCLTPEMGARLDKITLQKLNGSGLTL